MPFCTLLEWDADFDLDRYNQMNEKAGVHETLPVGCLARTVGPVDTGARIIEVWSTAEDAGRFSQEHSHLIAEFELPPPSRVSAFETTIHQTR